MFNVNIILRAALAFPFMFLAWKYVAEPIVQPLLVSYVQIWADTFHPELFARVILNSSTDTWTIESSLFIASSPWPDGTHLPTLQLSQKTIIPLANLGLYTLGLPLMWGLHVSYWSYNGKTLLFGHIAVVLGVLISTAISTSFSLMKAIDVPHMLRIFHEGYVYIPSLWPRWIIVLLKPLSDTSIMLAILLLPLSALGSERIKATYKLL